MRLSPLAIMLLISFLFVSTCTEGQSVYITDKGFVSFFSEAPIENIEGRHHGPQSILNLPKRELAFIIPIRGFHFEKSLMEEHFNEKYMESDRFPNATFTGTLSQPIHPGLDTSMAMEAAGKMTIHGVEQSLQIPGKAEVRNGVIRLTASFPIAVKSYGISIPKLLTENIADTVRVDLDITYKPFRKND
jgi:hypothetical protein